jgi:pyruvate dehydrogenase E2 component (dihydrolipoamide acetyltransferase)
MSNRTLADIYATPTVRALARELGVDLSHVHASGPKGRILREDVQQFVKSALSTSNDARTAPQALQPTPTLQQAPGTPQFTAAPLPDFSKFGAIERKPLSRIQRISGPALHRAWVTIPHVTNFDEADITDLEAYRVALNADAKTDKLTLLAFLMKLSALTLRKFPEINASLDGDALILKRYVHIGFAVDTPGGLLVPVVRDCDTKGVREIARNMADLSARARDGKLKADDMQGGTFSISSLGGIGGTGFTPIINAPEIAILGVVRASIKPVWNGTAFTPRLMLPMSMSWDHRAIDGAMAARFLAHLNYLLADLRRALL